jgi:hypothetical protein
LESYDLVLVIRPVQKRTEIRRLFQLLVK